MDQHTQDFLFWLKKMSLELPKQIDLTPITALLRDQQQQINLLQQHVSQQTLLLQDLQRQMQQQASKMESLMQGHSIAAMAGGVVQHSAQETSRQPQKRRMLIEPTAEELAYLGSSLMPTIRDSRSTLL